MRLAFQRAPVGLLHAFPGLTTCVDVNPRLCELLGSTRDELLQRNVLELVHPDDRAATLAATRDLDDEAHVSLDVRLVRKDGTALVCALQITTVRVDDHGPPRAFVVVTDRVDARRAEEAELRWAAMVEASPLAIALQSSRDGRILDVNPAYEALTGYRRDELLGRTAAQVGLVVDGAPWSRVLDEAAAVGRATARDLSIRTRAGETRRIAANLSRSILAGEPCVVEISRDITEEERAAAALRRREEEVRAAFENAPTGLGFGSPGEGRLIDVNARLCHLLGYTRAELLSTPILEFTHPDDRADTAAVLRAFGRAAITDTILVKRFIRRDGSVVDCEVNVARAPGAGEPRTVIGVVDITERRKAELALAASEARHRDLVDHLETPIVATDVVGTITYASAPIARFGYVPAALVGTDVARLGLPPPTAEPDASSRELAVVDATGRSRPVRSVARAVVRDGHVVGVNYLLTDLTSQRDVEEQLRAAQRMEAVGRLAGGVAHDFNNLLTVILSYGELAGQEVAPDAPVRESLHEIAQAARRAEGLTRQLLAFSRKQVMVLEVLPIAEVIAGVSAMLQRLIGEDVTLAVEVDPDVPAVRADRGQLEQVLLNLVINSRDAMPDGGTVTVGARAVTLEAERASERGVASGSYVELWVRDTGIGMDAETQRHVFEPFFTSKPVGKGTGLGLSTVYGIVAQLGGGLALESRPGEGATFRVDLPIARAVRTEAPPARALGRSARGSECVLVVEDDAVVRKVLRRMLGNAGYRVVVCESPEVALATIEATPRAIDLVLTDVIMPGMNGRVLAERIRAIVPDVPILFMSGYTDDTIGHLDVHGAFLRKPFSNDELRRTIRERLDAR